MAASAATGSAAVNAWAGDSPLAPAERAARRDWLRRADPLPHLGAIASLLFLLLAASGIYLYAHYDTSVAGSWTSLERLSVQQPWLGGLLRSLHRLAAGALVLVSLMHLLREALLGRFRGFRAITWLTGLPLLLLLYVSGIGGMWLPWDRLAQYAASVSAELLDALPLLGSALTRNLLHPEALDDRLFSLLIFVHIGVSMLLLLGLWFHLQRLTRPSLLPPRRVALAVLGSLLLVAALLPVRSLPPANLAHAPGDVALDWLLLHPLPLAEILGPQGLWVLAAGLLLLLALMPLIPSRRVTSAAVAVVDPGNCNGCRRCVDDCPYTAISLEAHPKGKAGRQLAVVDAQRCAACGICAGACPSATPFRRMSELVSGIDLPDQPIAGLRDALAAGMAGAGPAPLVVYACVCAADPEAASGPGRVVLPLACAAQLPPAFIEYAMRSGAVGVVVAHCSEHACEYRLGSQILIDRLAGRRPPQLRASVVRERLHLLAADRGQESLLSATVAAASRADLRPPPPRERVG